MAADFVQLWLERNPGSLSEADESDLRQFAADITRLLAPRSSIGDRLDEIALTGQPERPYVAVVIHPGWAKSVRWSFEWRLGDYGEDDDDHLLPLSVMLVDRLGNDVLESLETSPGLPLWVPDAEGLIHVDVNSDAYQDWPSENRALGSPFWAREHDRLMTLDHETRQLSPWVPPEGHPWRGLDP